MRNFELRIADQRVVLSVKWLQTRSRSRTHSSANPRANNTPKPKKHPSSTSPYAPNPSTTNNTPTTEISKGGPNKWRALRPPRVHQASLACAHHLRGRTMLPETSPWSQRPHSGAPKQPTPHDTPARTVTNTHSDFTGGVAPHPTLADPRRASAPAVVRRNNPRTTKVPREPRRTRIPTPPVESRRASPRPQAPSGPETSTSVFV